MIINDAKEWEYKISFYTIKYNFSNISQTFILTSKIYGLDTMRFLLNFVEYLWCRDVIAYLDIVFGNDVSKKSLPAY